MNGATLNRLPNGHLNTAIGYRSLSGNEAGKSPRQSLIFNAN